jgi:predicted GNAT family N-acyltransferase
MASSAQLKNLQIITVSWNKQQCVLKAIREAVFIIEQQVPVELEWDGEDETAIHILAQLIQQNRKQSESVRQVGDKQETPLAIGTARIIITNNKARIGRMAILQAWRGQGVGTRVLAACLDECRKKGVASIVLDAQVSAIPFYKKAGFMVTSDEFTDAGIAHRTMTLTIK